MKNWIINWFRSGRMNRFWSLLMTIILNNLVLFAFHLVIDGIGIFFLPFIFIHLTDSTIILISLIFLILWCIIPLALYLISGFLLRPTKYTFTDFISVFLFGLVGVMIWVDCWNHPTQDVLSSPWWKYAFYTGGLSMYDLLISKYDQYDSLRILYSIIPVLLSFCGLELKRRYKK